MKLFLSAITLVLMLAGCGQPTYDPQTMAAIQPCITMGFQPAQCVAAYQQAGRPSGSNDWITTTGAFAAGVVANHWWNRWSSQPQYTYQPAQSYSSPNQYVPQTVPQQPRQQPNQTVLQPVPEKNTSQLIPNQKVQPLFKPNVIVPNQSSTQTYSTKPVAPVQQFQPIRVAPAVQVPKAPKPAISVPAKSFSPVRVQPPRSKK